MAWPVHASNHNTGLPLEGVRVLDFSRVLAGPLCAMVVADLGADVIKVEGPGGDPVRTLAPPRFGDDATYYLAVNRHRRNIVADLNSPDDFARIVELVSHADAVVENFLPNQVASLRIDELRRSNPECVWVSVTPATSGGPLSAQPSFDLLAQARSGLMGVTGPAGGPASKIGAPLADVVTGLYAAVALVTGLVARLTGRPGRTFEAPLLESAMSALINQAQGYLSAGVNPRLLGNHHPSIAPYGPVTTTDGVILLAVGTDAQFARLLDVLRSDELRDELRWRENSLRVEDHERLTSLLDAIFSRESTETWLSRLETSGVPHAPVYDVAGAFQQPQIRHGDFVGEMETPYGRTLAMQSPLRVDGRRPPIRRGPRLLGEDTDEIFSALAQGRSVEEIDRREL